MKAFFRSFFASFFAFICVILLIIGMVGAKSSKKTVIKDHSYLVVDIYGDILPYDNPDGVMGQVIGGESETVQRILGNLEKASVDKRIDGVIMKVSSSNSLGSAATEEIRGAVKKVRDAGKPVYAFSDALDRKTVFLASACDSIFMPLSGNMDFRGFGGSASFVKKTLEKLGIKPDLDQIREYKSAAEQLTRTDSSPEAREMRQWIADDMWDMQIGAISEDRKLSEEKLVDLMRFALFTAHQAKDAGLIDRVLYWDELETRLKGKNDEKLRTVSQSDYAKVDRSKVGLKGKKKIAVIHAHGMIGGRDSRVDPLLGPMMGHETVAAELRRARKDKDIAAVVFRVDSRGGEGLASDLISREVEVTASVKPVVVSMIDVAASGGYMISYRASKLVADPMTITGSIGSIAMKFNMAGLYDKLGITFDDFDKGPNGQMFSDHRDFTEEEWTRFKANHWDGFNEWFDDVSKRRGIPADKLEKLAMGRVWTGRQAKENGLIDELGGLDKAISVAKELAGIPADQKVTLVNYPKKKSLLEVITGGGGVTAAVNWAVYRFFHEDIDRTLEVLAARERYAIE